MKIWIDIKNSHEPLLFSTISKELKDFDFEFTYRDFAEIKSLVKDYSISATEIGFRPEGNMLKRRLMFFHRVFSLFQKVPNYGVSLSHFSGHAIYASFLRRRPIIAITDNDINPDNYLFLKLIDFLFVPSIIDKKRFFDNGLRKHSLIKFDGMKEDLYVANYKPDPNFLDKLPFDDFVTIRPESLQAVYNEGVGNSIVPELIKLFQSKNINILYLPRYKSDFNYVSDYKGVFIPDKPLNGLDVCYYSKLVMTGAGTFSRECVSMGKKAVSFFPGNKLLEIDQNLVSKKLVLHSRNPLEILNFYLDQNQPKTNFVKAKKVQKSFLKKMSFLLTEISQRQKLQ